MPECAHGHLRELAISAHWHAILELPSRMVCVYHCVAPELLLARPPASTLRHSGRVQRLHNLLQCFSPCGIGRRDQRCHLSVHCRQRHRLQRYLRNIICGFWKSSPSRKPDAPAVNNITGQRCVIFQMIGCMIADNIHNRRFARFALLQIGNAITKTGTDAAKSLPVYHHAAVAVHLLYRYHAFKTDPARSASAACVMQPQNAFHSVPGLVKQTSIHAPAKP